MNDINEEEQNHQSRENLSTERMLFQTEDSFDADYSTYSTDTRNDIEMANLGV